MPSPSRSRQSPNKVLRPLSRSAASLQRVPEAKTVRQQTQEQFAKDLAAAGLDGTKTRSAFLKDRGKVSGPAQDRVRHDPHRFGEGTFPSSPALLELVPESRDGWFKVAKEGMHAQGAEEYIIPCRRPWTGVQRELQSKAPARAQTAAAPSAAFFARAPQKSPHAGVHNFRGSQYVVEPPKAPSATLQEICPPRKSNQPEQKASHPARQIQAVQFN